MVYYRSANSYYKECYGQKVYRIAVDGGFTCPNRDGTVGVGGCIFCSAKGSGDFAEDRQQSIRDQIEAGKKRVEAKLPKNQDHKYIAYFQAFTNTYGEVSHLRSLYEEALEMECVVGLSIATRPDCIDAQIADLLEELSQKRYGSEKVQKKIWIELGLQTIHERTATYIRRGYPLSVYDEALFLLQQRDIPVITHVILGLPGETREDMLETVSYVAKSTSMGIKLQLLHVIEGTDLARDYANHTFEALSMEEYVDLVAECVKRLPQDMVVFRLTGDGDKRTLIAPDWSRDKKRVLNALSKKVVPYT